MNPSTVLAKGIQAFNTGDYRRAGQAFEHAASTSTGSEASLFTALAQLSAGFKRADPDALRGVPALLEVLPSEVLGVDLDDLADLASRGVDLLENEGPEEMRALKLELRGEALDADDAIRDCQCPYCGEPVKVRAESTGAVLEEYVEDCSVCCRPWNVTVTRAGDEVEVTLGRDSD